MERTRDFKLHELIRRVLLAACYGFALILILSFLPVVSAKQAAAISFPDSQLLFQRGLNAGTQSGKDADGATGNGGLPCDSDSMWIIGSTLIQVDSGMFTIGDNTVVPQLMHPDVFKPPPGWGIKYGDTVCGVDLRGWDNIGGIDSSFEDTSRCMGDCDSVIWMPDTMYIDNIINNPRWLYWMVGTPLPCNAAEYENPFIRVSDDRVTWAWPYAIGIDSTDDDGDSLRAHIDTLWARDPIFGIADWERIAHFADPDIIYSDRSGDIWSMFLGVWDSSRTMKYFIVGIPSSDGIDWRREDTVHIGWVNDKIGVSPSDYDDWSLLSPSFNRNSDGIYELWFVDMVDCHTWEDSSQIIKLRSPYLDTAWFYGDTSLASYEWDSLHISDFVTVETCTYHAPYDSILIWHIDVATPPYGGPYRVMIATFTSDGCDGGGVYGQWLYFSEDCGLNWNLVKEIVPAGYFEYEKTYRTSFIWEAIDQGFKMPLWVSVQDTTTGVTQSEWGIGYTELYFTDYDKDGIADMGDNVCCNMVSGAGDADDNGVVNILDITSLISYIYKGGREPVCFYQGDADGNRRINLLDVTHLINYLYKAGPEPVCP